MESIAFRVNRGVSSAQKVMSKLMRSLASQLSPAS